MLRGVYRKTRKGVRWLFGIHDLQGLIKLGVYPLGLRGIEGLPLFMSVLFSIILADGFYAF